VDKKVNSIKEEFNSIIQKLTQEEKNLLQKIIKVERDKLYMSKPRGINDDIYKAVTEVIK
jgi:hypothetical protein